MRKCFIILVMFLSIFNANSALANELNVTPEIKAKPIVATIYINNAKSNYDDVITKKLTEKFNAKLAMYDVRPGEKYVEKLNKIGITDIPLCHNRSRDDLR